MNNISISQDILYQELDGDAVLLDIRTEKYFGLNKVGTRIWQLLPEHETKESLLQQLLNQYEAEEKVLSDDFDELLASLSSAGLITIENKDDEISVSYTT